MNKKPSKLEQAKEIVLKIDREKDGMSLEEATKFLAENWSKLYLRYGEDAENVLRDFFSKFYEKYPDTDDASIQPILGLGIAEEEHAETTRVMMWFTGVNCWASIWRDFLIKKGIKIRLNHEDRDDCIVIRFMLLKEINDWRREEKMRDLWDHNNHAEQAIKHSEHMAERGKVINTFPDYLPAGVLSEDVARVQFRGRSKEEVAKEIFKEIAEKRNALDPKVTGAGIGLWIKEDFIYATIRLSDECIPKEEDTDD
jgi:hypothetical protein